MPSLVALARAPRAASRPVWRRYRAIRPLVRWPVTIVLGFFLAVILVNVVFGAFQQRPSRDLVVRAGTSEEMTVRVGAGRNVQVRWEPRDRERGEDEVVLLQARLEGPDRSDALPAPAEAGGFDFKAGFSGGLYTLRLSNATSRDSLPLRIRWRIQ